MRKKVTIVERLARRPGPKSPASKAICERAQALKPRITRELNAKNRKSRRGAPAGNKNRLTHGRFTREYKAFMGESLTLWRQTGWLLQIVRQLSRAERAARLTS